MENQIIIKSKKSRYCIRYEENGHSRCITSDYNPGEPDNDIFVPYTNL